MVFPLVWKNSLCKNPNTKEPSLRNTDQFISLECYGCLLENPTPSFSPTRPDPLSEKEYRVKRTWTEQQEGKTRIKQSRSFLDTWTQARILLLPIQAQTAFLSCRLLGWATRMCCAYPFMYSRERRKDWWSNHLAWWLRSRLGCLHHLSVCLGLSPGFISVCCSRCWLR